MGLKKTKGWKRSQVQDKKHLVDRVVLKMIQKDNAILYGARSIQKQSDIARFTKDYDILTKNPKKSAKVLQAKLDKLMGFDYYYDKPAQHKGTFKVKGKGADLMQDTFDDEEVADFSGFPKPLPEFKVIDGIKVRSLKEEANAKRTALADKTQKFRHEKDADDLNRIKFAIKLKRLLK